MPWSNAAPSRGMPRVLLTRYSARLSRNMVWMRSKVFQSMNAGYLSFTTIFHSLIETAKLNGLNPQLYIADVLTRIGDHPARRIADLLPWNWKPAEVTRAA